MMIFWFAVVGMTLLALAFLVLPFTKTSRKNAVYVFIAALLFSALAIGLYLRLGAHTPLVAYLEQTQKNKLLEGEIKKLGSLQNIILTLEKKVKAHPDSEGWILLGRLYLKNQAFAQAVDAFAQANQLTPHQPEILVAYAESIYFAHHGVLTPQAKQLLAEVLQQEPNQPDALNLSAMDAYTRGDMQTARVYWKKLLPQLQEGSEAQKMVLQRIAEAEKKEKQ
jgi:cytochrome c-type biogenesis protein CcmH/NrfG